MKKVWIATQLTCSPVSGIMANAIGVYSSEDAAKAAIVDSIKCWREKWKDEGVEVDFDKMVAWFDYDSSDCCKWITTYCEV